MPGKKSLIDKLAEKGKLDIKRDVINPNDGGVSLRDIASNLAARTGENIDHMHIYRFLESYKEHEIERESEETGKPPQDIALEKFNAKMDDYVGMTDEALTILNDNIINKESGEPNYMAIKELTKALKQARDNQIAIRQYGEKLFHAADKVSENKDQKINILIINLTNRANDILCPKCARKFREEVFNVLDLK